VSEVGTACYLFGWRETEINYMWLTEYVRNMSRTYALYKRAMLCINVNALFQAFLNYPFLVAIPSKMVAKGIAWCRTEKSSSKRGKLYPYFDFSVNA
jgi:hypothetical protein